MFDIHVGDTPPTLNIGSLHVVAKLHAVLALQRVNLHLERVTASGVPALADLLPKPA